MRMARRAQGDDLAIEHAERGEQRRGAVAVVVERCRSLLRYMVRHKLVSAYGWVREEGAPRAECVCDLSLQGCACGANGRQIHRHFLLRGPRLEGFRRGWLPWAKLQAAAKRCSVGVPHIAAPLHKC